MNPSLDPWKGASAVWREKQEFREQLQAQAHMRTEHHALFHNCNFQHLVRPNREDGATHPTIPAGGCRGPMVRRGKDAVQVVTQ